MEIVLAKKWILASRAYRGNFLGQFGGQLLSSFKIIKHTASACIEWEQTKKKINSGNSEQIWKSGGRHDIKHHVWKCSKSKFSKIAKNCQK